MRLGLRYTRPALADLEEILAYIRDRSPQGARRVQRRLKATIDLLRDHPGIGVRTNDSIIRRTNAYPFPYLIFYEITSNAIVVHAIRHGARDPSTMPGAE